MGCRLVALAGSQYRAQREYPGTKSRDYMKERDGCLEDSTYTSKIYVVIATCAKRGLTMPTLPLRKPNRGLQKLNTSTAECKKSLGRQGFTVNSTSEKYACQFQLYARFFFRASCANPHRPSAGNSKRVWLF